MGESSSDFRECLLELMATTSPEPGVHPSADRWLAYQRGELAADEEARLQEHLARCRDCFDLAQAAAAFARPDEEPDVGGPDAAGDAVASAALWRLLRPQLGKVREISSAVPRRHARGLHVPLALAASFFVALVGLAAWSLHQQSTLSALRAPRADALIVDLSAGERVSTSEEVLLPADEPWTLVLHPADELPVYRLAVRDASGREISAHDLRPDEDLALTIHFPEGLPAGRYRLELAEGAGGRTGKVLEEHRVRVAETGGG